MCALFRVQLCGWSASAAYAENTTALNFELSCSYVALESTQEFLLHVQEGK